MKHCIIVTKAPQSSSFAAIGSRNPLNEAVLMRIGNAKNGETREVLSRHQWGAIRAATMT
jgi:hypothetical protein